MVGAGLALLALASCERTFVTNNYYTPSQDDAGTSSDATTNGLEASAGDANVDAAKLDAAPPVDAGDDAHSTTPPPQVADAAADAAGASNADDAGDGNGGALAEGVPVVNAALSEQQVDMFGTFNNHYWFIATPEQVDAINTEFQGGGGGWWGGYGGGDIYAPNSGADALNAVEHLVITTPDGKTADYGQMKVKLVGQSTGRPWTDSTLPNFKLDSDDITAGLRIGGQEHFRLNNAVVGTIFREKFVYDFYNALGYAAPKSSYAWVSTTVWGPEVKVPYIVTESYKRDFCRSRPEFGGECPNMWEFASDFGYGSVFGYPENCQYDECDSARAAEFETAVDDAYNGGATTLQDLGAYLDWHKFHEFHCLAWVFGTGDAPPINSNNTVWAERADGKFQLLPYSIDISLSLGYRNWEDLGLYGNTALARLCSGDEECWADTIAVCEDVVARFTAADPVARLDALYSELDAAGMLRSGDAGRYDDLRSVLTDMVNNLPAALDKYREPVTDQCARYGLVDCDGACTWPGECYLCNDDYYDNRPPVASGPIPVPTMGPVPVAASAIDVPVADVAPTAPVEPPAPVEQDAGAVVGVDAATPQKPDFCYYYYDYVKDQKEREVYAVR